MEDDHGSRSCCYYVGTGGGVNGVSEVSGVCEVGEVLGCHSERGRLALPLVALPRACPERSEWEESLESSKLGYLFQMCSFTLFLCGGLMPPHPRWGDRHAPQTPCVASPRVGEAIRLRRTRFSRFTWPWRKDRAPSKSSEIRSCMRVDKVVKQRARSIARLLPSICHSERGRLAALSTPLPDEESL